MKGLKKVESKFRDLNMKHLHVTKTDLEAKNNRKYIENLIVNKKPGIISQKTFISNETGQESPASNKKKTKTQN